MWLELCMWNIQTSFQSYVCIYGLLLVLDLYRKCTVNSGLRLCVLIPSPGSDQQIPMILYGWQMMDSLFFGQLTLNNGKLLEYS